MICFVVLTVEVVIRFVSGKPLMVSEYLVFAVVSVLVNFKSS